MTLAGISSTDLLVLVMDKRRIYLNIKDDSEFRSFLVDNSESRRLVVQLPILSRRDPEVHKRLILRDLASCPMARCGFSHFVKSVRKEHLFSASIQHMGEILERRSESPRLLQAFTEDSWELLSSVNKTVSGAVHAEHFPIDTNGDPLFVHPP